MAGSFPSVYLTTVSIIQGVALGILANNTFGYVTDPETSSLDNWAPFIPYAAFSFLVIVTVSFEYNWFVGMYRWSPKVWDTLIPFLLGIAEIGPMFYLTNPRIWWLLTAALGYVAALAFLNTFLNSKREIFENDEVYGMTRRAVMSDIAISAFLGSLAVVIGLTYRQWGKVGYWYITDFGAITLYLVVVALWLWKESRFVRRLHQAMDLKY